MNRAHNSLLKSFRFAINGLFLACRTERNMKIHFFASVVVIMAGAFFSVSKTEWAFLFTMITLVVALEAVNSALERVVDMVTSEYHDLAKQAKDIAAGAVLLAAMSSVVIGVLIFWPYVRAWLYTP